MKKSLKQILKDIAMQSQHFTITYRDRLRGFITVPAADIMRDGGFIYIGGQLIPVHRIVRITDIRTGEVLIERVTVPETALTPSAITLDN